MDIDTVYYRREADKLRTLAAAAHKAHDLSECWRLLDRADNLDRKVVENERRRQVPTIALSNIILMAPLSK